MKLLLMAVNAKYIHSNLAVYSLKASAGVYEPQVELAEYTINLQNDEMFQDVYKRQPDLLFISCYIWNRDEVLELAENLKKVMPELKIWMGGPEVTYDAMHFLEEHSYIEGVMIGEGERTFRRLLAWYLDGIGKLEEIPGIAYRDPVCRELRLQYPEAPMESLDELPFVYQNLEDFEHRIIYYESSRGCPFSCSYCLSSIDKRVRFRSIDLVTKELQYFLDHKVPQVKFVDRTFNCRHTHAMAIWKYILEHDNGITNFHFEIAADLLNEEELQLLNRMRPGLVQLEIGVQTTNEQALEAIHRTAKFEKIVSNYQRVAEEKNIHQHLDLIAGLPYEDYESFTHSFDDVYRLHPQELQLGFLKVLRGSEMYEKAGEYGIVYRTRQPYEVLETRWISCRQLLRLKEIEEMLEVYYNSQQFRHTIRVLESHFERPFLLYGALADFYREKKLTGRSWSRMQRFGILREFIKEQTGDFSLDEYLTLDIYLRENAKSRPEWAPDLAETKEQVTAFFQEEETKRQYLQEYTAYNWKQMMRMTHLEHFTVNVLGHGSPGDWWILFDYGKRDPLTGDAECILIQKGEIQ